MDATPRILVADDDERILQTMSRNLVLAGYRVLTASSGTDAVRRYQQEKPDIVLTDVRMPYVDGFEVLKKIRAYNPEAEVILVTGHGDMEMTISALRAGASDFIAKPVEQHVLEAALRHATDRLRLKRELRTAREKLRASEEMYRAITETALVGIGITVADGTLIFANQTLADMVGYSPDALVGMSLARITAPASFALYREYTAPAAGSECSQYEITLVRQDGTRLNAITSTTPLPGSERRTLAVITDITERKRTEAALRQAHDELETRVAQRTAELVRANAQYEGLVNSIDGIVWEADVRTLNFTFVSQQAQTLLGYDTAAWTNRPDFWSQHIHPDDRDWAVAYCQNAIRQSSDYEFEYRMIAADGHAVWLRDIVTVITKDGQPETLRGVMIDITARKRLEEHLEAIYQLGRNLTLLHDENTIVQRALETAAQVIDFAYANFGLVDESTNELIQRYYRSDADLVPVNRRISLDAKDGVAIAVARTGTALNIPDISKDARYVGYNDVKHVLRSELCVPMKLGERVIGVLNVESTELNCFTAADQQLLQALANQTAVALENARLYSQTQRNARELATLNSATHALASDLDLNMVLKQTMVEIMALLEAEDASVLLVDHEANDLYFAAVATEDAFEKLFGKHMPIESGIAGWAVRNRQSVLVDNAQVDTRFYSNIDVVSGFTTQSLLAVPLIARDQIIGVLEVINKLDGVFDAHDLELLEALASSAAVAIDHASLYQQLVNQIQMLRETQAQLIHSEKMAALGRLVASISHEINNPLQSIQGCLTLADEELESDMRPDKLVRYLNVAEDEIERIAAIVRRVRDFYRPSSHEQTRTDVHQTLESVLELSGKQLQHSEVTVVRQWAPDVPEITANADHLKQVFLNLVLNAIDAMPGGGTLTISTALAGGAVNIDFADTGVGMSEETLARLFEPFFTTKAHGSGLGLSISYGIIEAHHGQISARSAVGKGTTFTISLPVEQP